MSLPRDTRESTYLSVATFNAHGVKGAEIEIRDLSAQVQILGLTETWIRAQDLEQEQELDESVSVIQTHGGWRGQGGVGIKIIPLLNYSVVMKHSQPEFQILTINTGGTYISVVYIRPQVRKQQFIECLSRIQDSTRGRSVIMGDLNARHRLWDITSNSHGNWLVEWAKANHWTVDAPQEPTFSAHQGTSTVDLFLVKGVDSDGATILSGDWDGSSDHRAAWTKIKACPLYKVGIPRIPQNPKVK